MTFDSVEQRGFGRRSLRFALLCSILVHGLLLVWGVTQMQPSERASPAVLNLNAQLRVPDGGKQFLPPAASQRAPLRESTVASSREQVERRKIPRSIVPVEKVVPPAAASAKPVEHLADVAAVQPTAPSSLSSDARVATTGLAVDADDAVAGAFAADQKIVPPAAGVSADGLRRYRLNLAVQARSFKRYPAQARAAGWVGTVALFLSVDSEGRVIVAVNKSSGYGALDEAGRAMIEASAQRTPVPDVLRGKAFSLVIPVLFDLNDG